MNRIYLFFGIILVITSCNQGKKTAIKQENSVFDIPKDSAYSYFKYKDTLIDLGEARGINNYKTVSREQASKIDTAKASVIFCFKDSALITKNSDYGFYTLYKKFKPKYRFLDFKVSEIYTGKLAKPLINSCVGAYAYRTRIKEGCESTGVNFAGHYTIVIWGCGSECTYFAIVDRITGRIFMDFKAVNNSEGYYGYTYQKDSNLLFINDGLTDVIPGYVALSANKRPEYFEWIGTDFKKLN
jgi:hypothetical protein